MFEFDEELTRHRNILTITFEDSLGWGTGWGYFLLSPSPPLPFQSLANRVQFVLPSLDFSSFLSSRVYDDLLVVLGFTLTMNMKLLL
jgi:hypothetical protein